MPSKFAHLFLIHCEGTVRTDMYRDLYDRSRVYRSALERCLSLFAARTGERYVEMLYPPVAGRCTADDERIIEEPELSRPLHFGMQYALIELLKAMGVVPGLTVGYGYGEYLSMWLAGSVSLEEAVRLADADMREAGGRRDLRGLLLRRVDDEGRKAIEACGARTRIVVSDEACIVHGDSRAIDEATRILAKRGLAGTVYSSVGLLDFARTAPSDDDARLDVPAAPVLEAPGIPYLSGTTGGWLSLESLQAERSSRGERIGAVHDMRPSLGVIERMRDVQTVCIAVDDALADCIRACYPGLSGTFVSTGYRRCGSASAAAGEAGLLACISDIWASGSDLDWGPLVDERNARLVPLPAYPFQRKSFSLPEPPEDVRPAEDATPGPRRRPLGEWLYRQTWRLDSDDSGPSRTYARVLVLTDDSELLSDTCALLTERGHTVTIAVPHERFEKATDGQLRIGIDSPEDYDELFRHLAELGQEPDVIVHAWGLPRVAPGSFLTDPDLVVNRGIGSVVRLVQALGRSGMAGRRELKILTRGAQSVLPGNVDNPLGALLSGAVKVVDTEHARLGSEVIDLDPAGTDSELQLCERLLAPARKPVTALRNGMCFVPDYEAVPSATGGHPPLEHGGTYVITGGLGGIGLAIAEHLMEDIGANVVLVGRRAVDEPSAWSARASAAEGTSEERQMYARLAVLQALNGEVSVWRADVADAVQMRRLFEHAAARYGKINGLFHCAGLVDDGGVIRFRSTDSIAKVLRAKVTGTLILERLAEEFGLDLMVLSSSLSVVTHFVNFGQIGYAAANEFLDALAAYKAATGRVRTISIDWESWKEAGMAVRASLGSFGRLSDDVLRYAITNREGRDVLSRALESDQHRVIVCTRDLREVLRFGAAQERPDAEPGDGSGGSATELDSEAIQRKVAGVWRELLGVECTEADKSFLHAGGDSLMVVQMVSRLQSMFDVQIDVEDVFNGPTIGEISRTIESTLMVGKVTKDRRETTKSDRDDRVEYKI